MTDSQLLSQTIFSATNVLFYDIKKVMFLFIFRTLLVPVLTGSVRYTDELILWAFNSGPHSTDMRQVVQSSWVESCTPVCIGHRGEWSEERAVDDRCVLHPACLSRFRTTVVTVAFANEEQTGDVENAWAVMGWSVRVRGDADNTPQTYHFYSESEVTARASKPCHVQEWAWDILLCPTGARTFTRICCRLWPTRRSVSSTAKAKRGTILRSWQESHTFFIKLYFLCSDEQLQMVGVKHIKEG